MWWGWGRGTSGGKVQTWRGVSLGKGKVAARGVRAYHRSK